MVLLGELLRLSAAAYTRKQVSGRWALSQRFERRRGFVATLWSSTNSDDRVLSVRGTKSVRDGLQDLRLLFGKEPRAWREGRDLLRIVQAQLESSTQLYLTGHSIGGAYASAMGAQSSLQTVTFNAPGMRDALVRSNGHADWLEQDFPHVLNVCSSADFIWRLSGPGVSSSRMILRGHRSSSIQRTGIRGVLDAWREEKAPRRFFQNAMRCHGLHSFSLSEPGGPWRRDVTALLASSEQEACAQ
ncbi:MAG: hypothetical protein ACI9F9_002033 [Candidatus Paceibacteria bacterium]